MTKLDKIYKKAIDLDFLNFNEAMLIYQSAPLGQLMLVANQIRKIHKPGVDVGWIIDRNVNITNVCLSQCKFCNYYRKYGSDEAYITTIEEYKEKIEELFLLGGNQLLLQGGLHPRLKTDFYENLFGELKKLFPQLKLHALGPAEIVHLSKLDKISYSEVLIRLTKAGLDSLPGAGAEILVDRVRKIISPNKCSAQEWLDVMHEAHKLNITTSATMMFGHIETVEERIQHLFEIRNTQARKPIGSVGFTTFIPWTFQDDETVLQTESGINNSVTGNDYIRMIAMCRIILSNIQNIQASWLTVGKNIGQVCLHAGANDFGSIMIEENVVSSAGASYKFDAAGIQHAIKEAGFNPRRRNQKYEWLDSQN